MSRLIQSVLVVVCSFLLYAFVLFRLPSIQLVKYSHAAELLLQNKLYGERILDFSPLYLYLNTLLKQLHLPLSTLMWIHIICSALAAGLLFQLLRRYFRLSLAIAGTAAFILDRSLMVYTHTFEPEPIVVLLILAATNFASTNTSPAALWGGLCFGLGILTRPNFVPVLLAVPFFYKENSRDNSWRKKTALFVLPPLLCLTGLWIRNATIVGYFSPFVMNPGTALYEGNNPNSRGMSSVYPPLLNQISQQYSRQPDYHHQVYRDFARRITGKNLTLPEVNSYWTAKATNFLRDHPIRTIQLFCTKILHFFHQYQWHDLSVAYLTEKTLMKSWRWNTPFALMAAFALLGLWGLKSEWKRYLIFYAVFISQFLFMLSIYVSARQRTSILFLFVFFACGGVQYILTSRKRWFLLILAALLCLPLYLRTDFMWEEEHLWENIRQSDSDLRESYLLRNQGKLDAAANKSAQALAHAPWFMDSRRPANIPFEQRGYKETALIYSSDSDPANKTDKAVLLLEAGLAPEAESIFQQLHQSGYRLKRDDYQSSDLQFYLARCALKQQNTQKAVALLKTAVRSSPGDPSSLAYLKALTGQDQYENQLYRYFDEIDAAFFLGVAYLETERPESAVKYFQYVTRMLPEFRKGFIYLAAAMSQAGHYKEAATHYRKAISLNSDPVFRERELLKIFQELTLQEPTAIHHYSYGIVLRQFGHFQLALSEQQKAIELDTSNQEIINEIHRLQKVLTTLH